LAFAHVGRQFDDVAIGAMKSFIDVEDGLDVVIAGWELFERDERITEGGGIDHGWGTGFPGINIQTKELRAEGFLLAQLKAGLAGFVCGDAEEDVAVERFVVERFREGNFEAEFGGGFWGLCDCDRKGIER
jgi:hypothetical protein